jgi:hypothetical protein
VAVLPASAQTQGQVMSSAVAADGIVTEADVAAIGNEEPLDDLDDQSVDPEDQETGEPGTATIPGVTDQPDAGVIDPGDDVDWEESELDETDNPATIDASALLPLENRDDTPPQDEDLVDDQATLMDVAQTYQSSAVETASFAAAEATQPGCPRWPATKPLPFPASQLGTFICVKEADDIETRAAQAAAMAAASAAPSAADQVFAQGVGSRSLPSWCIGVTKKWKQRRFDACKTRMLKVDMYRQTGQEIRLAGTLTYSETRWSHLSSFSRQWENHLTLSVGKVAGSLKDLYVQSVGSSCSNSCKTHWKPANTFFDRVGLRADFNASIDANVSAGKRRSMTSNIRYQFLKYDVRPSAVIKATSNTVRCDKALKGASTIGCVVPSYVPVMKYSKTGSFPQLARHIDAAQRSGLPGAYPRGKVLTRLTDSKLAGKNRSRSCPKSIKKYKPRGKTCDEYPFASTRQGPYVAKKTNPRTFEWCSLPADSDDGPNGYSRCYINGKQNSEGGTQLGIFYGAYTGGARVLSGDAFRVQITP